MENIDEVINAFNSFSIDAHKIFITEKLGESLLPYFHLGIVTSTPDEFESVKKMLENVTEFKSTNQGSGIFYEGSIKAKSKDLKVILPYPVDMGIEASVCVTTNILSNFKLKYLFMCGICAGNKNVTKIGDIIIADKSINYNNVVDLGKSGEKSKQKFMQNADSIDRNFKAKLTIFARSNQIKEIKLKYTKKSLFENELKCHIGLLVSGSSLVRSDDKIKELNESYHGIKGMDMETHGFYYANSNFNREQSTVFVSIKSVSDFGDNTNTKPSAEERRKYALYTSSKSLIEFIKSEL